MDSEAYLRQLQALLPLGAAWPRDDSATLTQMLWALAAEFARVDGRATDLINEADPRSTLELLPDWERAYGLPATCMAGIAQTLQQRRNALVAQITGIGGQSRQYFIGLALSAGFTITITEFSSFTVGSGVNDPIYDNSWRYYWQVNAPSSTVEQFSVASTVGEGLQTWGNQLLECLIGRLKPAHTRVLFAYI